MSEFFGFILINWIFLFFGYCVRTILRYLKQLFSSSELLDKKGKRLKPINFFDEENEIAGGIFIVVMVILAGIIF
jgi:hypothetical protein